jgi:two-component system, OmpR family, phosphate regulon response regulator OmpR
VFLAIRGGPAARLAAHESVAPAEQRGLYVGRGHVAHRVLLIDDDERLSRMLARYLGNVGFEVATVAQANRGLEALRSGRHNAVILDLMLPDLDGLEICRRIRAHSDVPIIMLTARGADTDRIAGLELGADDYLPKPFNPRELLARLRAVLRRRGIAEGAPILRFGSIEIDPGERSVRVGGSRRALTSHQFDLLYELARCAGRVVSRAALPERVHDSDALERSIDLHVSRIRAAIEPDPRMPRHILTVRGAGYMFARDRRDADRP